MKYSEQESVILEFKREIPKNDQIIKTIIGFCNQRGGTLILGIDDDGTIIGVDETKAQEIMEYLEKSILDASFPPIIARVYSQHIANKVIVLVEVSQGMNKESLDAFSNKISAAALEHKSIKKILVKELLDESGNCNSMKLLKIRILFEKVLMENLINQYEEHIQALMNSQQELQSLEK